MERMSAMSMAGQMRRKTILREQLSNGIALRIDEQEVIDNAGVTAQDIFIAKTLEQGDLDKLDPLGVRCLCDFCGCAKTKFWSTIDFLYNGFV